MLGQSLVTKNIQPFSSQREESQKSEIKIKLITNLWWSSSDDTHRALLHNTCMFCSIKFIFISKNLSLHWHVMFSNVFPPKHPVNLQRATTIYKNTHHKLWWKIQVLYIGLKINFSLMQPLCQISKKLYGKSTPCNNLSTAPRHQNKPYRYPPCCGVNRSQK